MKNLVWLLAFISLAVAGAIKIDVDQFRSPDHTKVWTPPSSTTTLIGTDTNNDLTNKTLDKLVSTSEQVNAVATGANAVVTTPTSLVVQLTNVSLTSIDGITAPANNQIVILKNKTGANVTVNNETGVNTTYRIKTGTGANLTLATDASVILAYSTTDSRWQVVGGSGSGGGGLSAWVTAHGYLTGDVVIESNKIYKALSDHTSGTFATDLAGGKWVEVSAMDGVDLSTNQTIGGIKTFSSTIVGSVNGNAATVTTNANLTGPITSTGNATAVASQTGTGSKFVMDTSPTLVTPVLGVATATSINGTTIPTSKTLQDKDALTAKGDLYVATASATTARQAVGSNKQVLMADSAQTNGIKWADSQVLSKSETDGADVDTIKFQTPKAQLTTTATGVRRIETGNRNVLQDPNAEASATPWGVYADAAGTSPVDGTGGSPSVTVANSNTSPLEGAQSLVFTKDAANRQGQGMSLAFTIDSADKTKVLRVDFDYQISSGTYADDDMSCWVYDVTNSALIQPAPYKIKNVTGIEPFAMEFQATTSTSYRLICHVASTSASAYTVKFDNFFVGRGSKVYGSPVGNWVDSGITTSTSGWQGFGTIAAVSIQKKVIGDSLFLRGSFTAGTITSTEYRIPLPPEVVLSSTYSANTPLGTFYFNAVLGGSSNYAIGSSAAGNAYLNLYNHSSTVGYTLINTTSPMPGDGSVFYFETGPIPIQGWSSSNLSSSEADTRVVAAKAVMTSNYSATSNTAIVWQSTEYDTHGGFSSGRYTIPSAGYYRSTVGEFAPNTSNEYVSIYKNGSKQNSLMYVQTTSVLGSAGAYTAYYVAGDIIDIRISNTQQINFSAGNYGFRWSIEKVSGPSQIQSSETVAASYWLSANFAASTTVPINFDSKEYDSHGAVTTSATAWKFTAPMSGTYSISTKAFDNGATIFSVYKNGSAYKVICVEAGTEIVNGQIGIKLLAGEYVDIRPSASVTVRGGTLTTNNTAIISITRTGNY